MTYLGFVIAIAVISGVMAATAEVWVTAQRRDKEVELLFIGNQFRQALAAYNRNTPGSGGQSLPKQLDELLKDNRYPGTKRYLRNLYVDPMTGKADWGMLRLQDGGIVGIYSLSERQPLKTGGFRPADAAFQGKAKYSEWVFMYSGQAAPLNQQGASSLERGRTGR